MRYLIVTYDDYFNIPYIKYYEDFLKEQKQAYDIILWNRSGKHAEIPNSYVYNGKDSKHKIGKILPFLKWRRFVLQVLKKQKYDRLIILTTIPAVLISDKLLREYRGKYWLDIRDFTYENVSLYKKVVGKLVKAAGAVSISSPAFQCFLPKNDNIYLTHNISNQNAVSEYCDLDTNSDRFCIGFVGGVQFVEQNQMLLRQFANNKKFLMRYVGKAHLGCDLPLFCEENGIRNAEFLPAFENHQKPGIYQDIQLINSVYGCNSLVVRLALPNRLYDCALFKKPIIVSQNTYLAEVVQEYAMGVAVDVEREDVVEKVEAYLNEFDRNEFINGCKKFLEKVNAEVEEYKNALRSFCAEIERDEYESYQKGNSFLQKRGN